jgi:hypothetical protein
MEIHIKTIPHSCQRYNTAGDFYMKDGILYIMVSETGVFFFNALIAIHEFVEYLLCRYAGITIEQIDCFDIAFEKKRKKGNLDEPGDDPKCIYKRQHLLATGIEKIVASCLGVCWKSYNDRLDSL